MAPNTHAPALPVLVIDDEVNISKALGRLLGKMGYTTVLVETCEAGLDALAQEAFAFIITDLMMNGMGGHAFLRKIREQSLTVPVIVISGHGAMDDVIECLRQGASDFLSKPFSDAAFRESVHRAISGPGWASAVKKPMLPAAVVAPLVPEAGSNESTADLDKILSHLRSGEIPLPALPEIALAARKLSMSEHGSAQAMKELVERDSKLTARIMRLSNSSYYARYGTSSTLQAAIARVGFREIGHLIDALIARDFYAGSSPALKDMVFNIWRRSWVRAVAMRFLAGDFVGMNIVPEQAFLAGMLCDIGIPFLAKVVTEVAPTVSPPQAWAFIQENHVQVGMQIMEAWKFPPACLELTATHHKILNDMSKMSSILQLYALAEEVCAEILQPGTKSAIPSIAEKMTMSRNAMEYVRARTRTYVAEHPLDPP